MPKLREVVDPDTGEVYHVETTRQAKRRHQRSAGVPQPTIGQINAADIWNRQEEKIKKDREREERRKKNKEKEEAKEARLKELQQEKLRLGRITIEDTWGKVNASQNRLHAFFGPPKKNKAVEPEVAPQLDNTARSENTENLGTSEANVNDSLMLDDLLEGQDLDSIFTGSPLSPELSRTTCKTPGQNQLRSPIRSERVHPHPQAPSSTKRRLPQSSAAMMPPPKRPRLARTSSAQNQLELDMANSSCNKSLVQARSPLTEMTPSQLNVRASEKPDLLMEVDESAKCWPVATQIVRDTLSGLCSQDLDDDFAEDKENASPLKSPEGQELQTYQEDLETRRSPKDTRTVDAAAQIAVELEEEYHVALSDVFDDLEDETFDDGGIDDESLLALAATQQLRNEFITSSKRKRTYSHTTSTPRRSSESLPPLPSWNLGDSFTMDNVSDEDLLRGLEVYENNTETGVGENKMNLEEINTFEPVCTKKRRTLPWVKNPITDSLGYDEFDDEVIPSMFLC